MRTIVYNDGFNLYCRALKGTSHKWPDVAAMSRAALPTTCQIERVNYYTAHVSGRIDPTSPARQHAYLRALSTVPGVVIHYGNFFAVPALVHTAGGSGAPGRLCLEDRGKGFGCESGRPSRP